MRWRLGLAAGAANAGMLIAAVLWVAPERLVEASCAVVIAGGGWLAFAEAACQSRDDRVHSEPLSLLTGVTLLSLSLWSACHASPQSAPAVGAVLMALGVTLRAASMRALAGDFVSEARTPTELCTRGIYRWLRHPSETGLLALSLGHAVASGAAGSWYALAAIAWLSLLRIHREELALRASLGCRYEAYAARVPALLPRYTFNASIDASTISDR